MEQGGADGLGIQLQIRQDIGHLHRVGDIGLAGLARLALVLLHGVVIGLLHQLKVICLVILPNPVQQGL